MRYGLPVNFLRVKNHSRTPGHMSGCPGQIVRNVSLPENVVKKWAVWLLLDTTDKNFRRLINPTKGFIKSMNPLIIVFFVCQSHKPFEVLFLLIYPKRVFHTLQYDKRFGVHQQL